MRALSLALLVGSAVAGTGGAFAADATLVPSPVDKIYAPVGFDSNDNAEVIVEGNFPNSCYRTGPVSAVVDSANKTITVDPQAYMVKQFACLEFLVPYIQVVKLGPLEPGSYRIGLKNQTKAADLPLEVSSAHTPAQDDALYAPIEATDLQRSADGRDVVRLEGRWPYTLVGCMVMKEVKIQQTPGNVLVVRPLASLAPDGSDCASQKKTKRFTIDTPLSSNLQQGDYLIHVRSLNGNSVNRNVSLEPDGPVNH